MILTFQMVERLPQQIIQVVLGLTTMPMLKYWCRLVNLRLQLHQLQLVHLSEYIYISTVSS